MLWDTWIANVSWMSQEVRIKGLGSVGYICRLNILHLGYDPFTNHVLTSWDILVTWILYWQIPGVPSAPSPHVGPSEMCWTNPLLVSTPVVDLVTPEDLQCQGTPRKLTNRTWKDDAWKSTVLSFLGWSLFRGELLNFRGVNYTLLEIKMSPPKVVSSLARWTTRSRFGFNGFKSFASCEWSVWVKLFKVARPAVSIESRLLGKTDTVQV